MHTCILFFVRSSIPSLPSLLSPSSSPNALTDSILTVRLDCYINGLHVPFAGRRCVRIQCPPHLVLNMHVVLGKEGSRAVTDLSRIRRIRIAGLFEGMKTPDQCEIHKENIAH